MRENTKIYVKNSKHFAYFIAQNVMGIGKLALRFNIRWLLDQCERSVINKVDIPLIQRLLFADRFGLKALKVI